MNINLDENLCSTFRQVVVDILEANVSKVVLKGGRNTTKSAVAVIAGLVFVLKYQCSALMIVEHGNKATERLSKNILKYMNILGIKDLFVYRKKPDRFILKNTKGELTPHEIYITGASDPDDIKSITNEDGGYSYVFLEEAANFKRESDVTSIFNTAMRGDTGAPHVFVMAFNPPFDPGHYLNVKYGSMPCGKAMGFPSNYHYEVEKLHSEELGRDVVHKCLIHHSTYLDIVKEHLDWLGGDAVVAEYELQRKENPKAWLWDKIGVVMQTDAQVFSNIKDWVYDKDIGLKERSKLYKVGVDCSNGASDPWALVILLYVPQTKSIYILDERRVEGRTNGRKVDDKMREVANAWAEINPINLVGYGDSAVPYNVEAVRNQTMSVMGHLQHINIYPAKNGFHYNKRRSVLFLQTLNNIYIDKNKTPFTYNEMTKYCYKVDRANNITNELVDGNDHFVDAVIYSMVDVYPYN